MISLGENIAVVGSRQGADLEHVKAFLTELYSQRPTWTVVSGGAMGVDEAAEQTWLELGGLVTSFRATQFEDYWGDQQFGVRRVDLGGDRPRARDLKDLPTFADYVSALHYRNMLIAEMSPRVVAFYRRGRSNGAASTVQFARNEGHLVWEYEAA